jgi:hypothetical protein
MFEMRIEAGLELNHQLGGTSNCLAIGQQACELIGQPDQDRMIAVDARAIEIQVLRKAAHGRRIDSIPATFYRDLIL